MVRSVRAERRVAKPPFDFQRNEEIAKLVIQLAQQLFDRVIPESHNRESIAAKAMLIN